MSKYKLLGSYYFFMQQKTLTVVDQGFSISIYLDLSLQSLIQRVLLLCC